MSCVHYKFKSCLDYKTLTFDGLHISVGDLKREIFEKEKIDVNSIDLQLTNAQTKRIYNEDTELIPRNSSVWVAKTPALNAKKLPKIQNRDTEGVVTKASKVMMMMSGRTGTILSDKKELHDADIPEAEKVQRAMKMSTEAYHTSKYLHRNALMTGVPPPTYVCNRCNKSGHWFKNCPLISVRKTTGIPKEALMETTKDDPHSYMHPSGKFVVPIMHQQARLKGKKEKPPFMGDDDGGSTPPGYVEEVRVPVPKELTCSLCLDLLRDAVLIQCCGYSFCDECIRAKLLDSDQRQCPHCSETEISPDTLVPNTNVRQAVMSFKNETGYSYVGKPEGGNKSSSFSGLKISFGQHQQSTSGGNIALPSVLQQTLSKFLPSSHPSSTSLPTATLQQQQQQQQQQRQQQPGSENVTPTYKSPLPDVPDGTLHHSTSMPMIHRQQQQQQQQHPGTSATTTSVAPGMQPTSLPSGSSAPSYTDMAALNRPPPMQGQHPPNVPPGVVGTPLRTSSAIVAPVAAAPRSSMSAGSVSSSGGDSSAQSTPIQSAPMKPPGTYPPGVVPVFQAQPPPGMSTGQPPPMNFPHPSASQSRMPVAPVATVAPMRHSAPGPGPPPIHPPGVPPHLVPRMQAYHPPPSTNQPPPGYLAPPGVRPTVPGPFVPVGSQPPPPGLIDQGQRFVGGLPPRAYRSENKPLPDARENVATAWDDYLARKDRKRERAAARKRSRSSSKSSSSYTGDSRSRSRSRSRGRKHRRRSYSRSRSKSPRRDERRSRRRRSVSRTRSRSRTPSPSWIEGTSAFLRKSRPYREHRRNDDWFFYAGATRNPPPLDFVHGAPFRPGTSGADPSRPPHSLPPGQSQARTYTQPPPQSQPRTYTHPPRQSHPPIAGGAYHSGPPPNFHPEPLSVFSQIQDQPSSNYRSSRQTNPPSLQQQHSDRGDKADQDLGERKDRPDRRQRRMPTGEWQQPTEEDTWMVMEDDKDKEKEKEKEKIKRKRRESTPDEKEFASDRKQRKSHSTPGKERGDNERETRDRDVEPREHRDRSDRDRQERGDRDRHRTERSERQMQQEKEDQKGDADVAGERESKGGHSHKKRKAKHPDDETPTRKSGKESGKSPGKRTKSKTKSSHSKTKAAMTVEAEVNLPPQTESVNQAEVEQSEVVIEAEETVLESLKQEIVSAEATMRKAEEIKKMVKSVKQEWEEGGVKKLPPKKDEHIPPPKVEEALPPKDPVHTFIDAPLAVPAVMEEPKTAVTEPLEPQPVLSKWTPIPVNVIEPAVVIAKKPEIIEDKSEGQKEKEGKVKEKKKKEGSRHKEKDKDKPTTSKSKRRLSSQTDNPDKDISDTNKVPKAYAENKHPSTKAETDRPEKEPRNSSHRKSETNEKETRERDSKEMRGKYERTSSTGSRRKSAEDTQNSAKSSRQRTEKSEKNHRHDRSPSPSSKRSHRSRDRHRRESPPASAPQPPPPVVPTTSTKQVGKIVRSVFDTKILEESFSNSSKEPKDRRKSPNRSPPPSRKESKEKSKSTEKRSSRRTRSRSKSPSNRSHRKDKRDKDTEDRPRDRRTSVNKDEEQQQQKNEEPQSQDVAKEQQKDVPVPVVEPEKSEIVVEKPVAEEIVFPPTPEKPAGGEDTEANDDGDSTAEDSEKQKSKKDKKKKKKKSKEDEHKQKKHHKKKHRKHKEKDEDASTEGQSSGATEAAVTTEPVKQPVAETDVTIREEPKVLKATKPAEKQRKVSTVLTKPAPSKSDPAGVKLIVKPQEKLVHSKWDIDDSDSDRESDRFGTRVVGVRGRGASSLEMFRRTAETTLSPSILKRAELALTSGRRIPTAARLGKKKTEEGVVVTGTKQSRKVSLESDSSHGEKTGHSSSQRRVFTGGSSKPGSLSITVSDNSRRTSETVDKTDERLFEDFFGKKSASAASKPVRLRKAWKN